MANAMAGFGEAFSEAIMEFPCTATIGGRTVTCIVSEATITAEMMAGGYMPDGQFTIRARIADLPATPTEGDQVIYVGAKYRIESVAIDNGNPICEINLKPWAR